MMKVLRTSLCLLSFAAGLSARASVGPGENIVANGRFEADQVEVPLYWEPPEGLQVGKEVFYDQSGGPQGIPCVRFVNTSEKPMRALLRQQRFRFVPGATYRLSAWIRTKGFHGNGGPLTINAGWLKTAGIAGFAADSEWKRYERTFEMMPSDDLTVYSVAFYISDFTGEIAVADLRLEAVDEAAQKGTEPPALGTSEKVPRFFPWSPRLGKIDAQTRAVSFFFTGRLPEGDSFADYTATLSVPSGTVSRPLREGVNPFVLPAGCESGRLSYEVRKKGAAAPLLAGSFLFRTRPKPVIDATGHRMLNNFVTEILRTPAADGLSQDFFTTCDGWIFVRAAAKGSFELTVDGVKVMDERSPRHEVFRSVDAGRHCLTMKGNAKGTVVVRQITEIFDDPPCFDSYVTGNPSYGWDFFSKHVWPHATTFERGHIPPERRAEFKAKGSKWLNDVISRWVKADVLPGLIRKNAGMTSPDYDGVDLDEQFFGTPESIEPFVGGMRRFHAECDDGDRLVYSCLVGKPLLPGSDREALALAANASFGRGKALSEIYCRTKPTEEDARVYLQNYIAETVRKVKEFMPGVEYYPDVLGNFCILLANFSQIPTLSVWYHPEVDFKYYLDMQFNEIANNPLYRGLGAVGVWGSHYCDEEMHRWTFMLTRHYCIEGRKDMLSERYGLAYLPGIVTNGDFRESLDGWKTSGTVRRETIYKLSDSMEKRWCGNEGDSFAVLVKEKGKTARLSQTLRNLTPGRTYSLDVLCFDAKDARTKTWRPDRFPLNVTLGKAAEKDESLSWVFVDRRPQTPGRYESARINRHHIVFTANAASIPLSLDNADAEPGQEIGVNGIGAWPYVRDK